jgi:hypothetical protein
VGIFLPTPKIDAATLSTTFYFYVICNNIRNKLTQKLNKQIYFKHLKILHFYKKSRNFIGSINEFINSYHALLSNKKKSDVDYQYDANSAINKTIITQHMFSWR